MYCPDVGLPVDILSSSRFIRHVSAERLVNSTCGSRCKMFVAGRSSPRDCAMVGVERNVHAGVSEGWMLD